MNSETVAEGTGGARHWMALALGPVSAAAVVLLWNPSEPHIDRMAGIALWMAIWWVTEAVPIAITSLLPLVLIPLAGIAPVSKVSLNYGKSTIFLFLGGFLMALGLQRSEVHKRVALWILHTVGSTPRRIVMGFMFATAALSMWISNTSSVMLMLPIGLAVLAAVADRGADEQTVKALGVAVMLGIAYSADIGGMATPVGTPPNLAYMQLLPLLVPDAPEPSFLSWMMMALPLSCAFLFLGWLLLTRVIFKLSSEPLMGGPEAIGKMRAQLGPIRRDEALTAAIFASTALLWVTISGFQLGELKIPGWRELLGLEMLVEGKTVKMVDDGVVAIAMATLLFIIPSKSRPGEKLLDWEISREVPWGILLLFGGGFALAYGFQTSRLSHYAGSLLVGLRGVSPYLVVLVVCVCLTLLTELTSNTATTNIVLPILAPAAVAMGLDPRVLMIPATLSASCAFMMPVASPTQAIVFGSGYVPIREMVRAGIWFNLLGVILVMLVFFLLAGPAFGIRI